MGGGHSWRTTLVDHQATCCDHDRGVVLVGVISFCEHSLEGAGAGTLNSTCISLVPFARRHYLFRVCLHPVRLIVLRPFLMHTLYGRCGHILRELRR